MAKNINKNKKYKIAAIIFSIIILLVIGLIINQIFFEKKGNDKNSKTEISINENQLIIGNPDAKITIIEYSDFECPYCKKLYTGAYQDIKTNYIDTGKVKIIFKHFPLTNIHPNALNTAIAVECANEQNKGQEMHDSAFENEDLSVVSLKSMAKELNLDTDKFNTCLDSQKYKDKVMADQAEGISKGVRGTPTFYINDEQIVGAQSFSAYKNIIEKELAK